MKFRKAFFFIMALVIGSFAAAGILTSLQTSSAEFVVTSLDIPATAEVEERVTITAYVANTGGKEDTYTATLTVDGKQVEGGTAEATVPGGEARPVQFALTIHEAGSYVIAIDGESGLVVVTAPQ
jgi:uncharacterized protein (DUF58 family)